MQQHIRATSLRIAIAGLILASAALCGPSALAQPPTCIGSGGTIAANATWSADCTLADSVTVAPGATLTIIPGVDVFMDNPNTRITIDGRMLAQGSAVSPIRFTSGQSPAAPGDWGRIVFGTTSSGSLLDQVIVEYGGYGIGVANPAIEIRTSGLTISNSTVQKNLEDGIAIQDASPTIKTTQILDNGLDNFGWALDLYGASSPTLTGLSASGNLYNGIAINGTTIAANRTWDGGGLGSYLIIDDVTIAPGATLTLTPGLTIYLDNPNTDLVVQGTLKAQGTTAAPIRFRSGNAFTPGNITPQIGDWGSIMFKAGSNNSLLEYAIVEEGGGIDAGIATESSSLTIRNNTITRNNNGGIRVIEGAPTITRNNFIGNTAFGEYGVRNTGTSRVTATCNWWGAASGPTHISNPNGTGQGVTDDVVFAPWLVGEAPGGVCTGTNVYRIYLPLTRR
jgi:hypothetical protein